MRYRSFILCVALLTMAGIIGAGCGGDADEGATAGEVTTSSLSKAEFVKKANAVCVKANQEVLEEMREFADEPDGASAQEAIQQIWPTALRRQAEEVRSLGAPKGDEAKVEAVLIDLEEVAGEVEAEKPADIVQLQKVLVRVNGGADGYGIEHCGF